MSCLSSQEQLVLNFTKTSHLIIRNTKPDEPENESNSTLTEVYNIQEESYSKDHKRKSNKFSPDPKSEDEGVGLDL
jgi:hypothetical protein